ncbi:contractile injection system tape measure protein [Flavobacterium collinsii]|uniref:Uncharacterized protein n=1 Tax=Flavobacterium collinsii TaxID=1114861 RepID=A0A9W4TGL9_9FLAO|nr:contractile injection system tape measure protein [Flavobacterium collinsii]CAI2766909.1 conserved protein of unknown function [Flavobacterium collinsii]
MQSTDSHIISKLFLEVNTHSKEKAYYLKDHLDTFLKEELFPLLETYFDTLDKKTPLYSIQIEKLDLNLSVAPDLNFNTVKLEIINQCQKQIEEQIEKGFPDTKQYKLIDRKEKNRDEFFIFLETGANPWWAISNDNGNSNSNSNGNENENGNNNDNSNENVNNNSNENVNDNGIFNSTYSDMLGTNEDHLFKKIAVDKAFNLRLRKTLETPQIRARFIKQLSDEQIYNLLQRTLLLEATASDSVLVSEMVNQIKRNINTIASESKHGLQQRNLIWDIVLLQLLQHDDTIIKEKVLQLLTSFAPVRQYDSKFVLEHTRNYISDKPVLKILASLDPEILNIIALLNQKASEILPKKNKETFLKSDFSESEQSPLYENRADPDNPKKPKTETETEINSVFGPNKKNEIEESSNSAVVPQESNTEKTTEINGVSDRKEKAQKKTQEKAKEEVKEEVKETENWPSSLFPEDQTIPEIPSVHYVNNAGLILVHPFLKALFEHCGLLNTNHTINDSETAAHLLHYIATGREQDYESEMLFEKVLCNIPINQTINRNIVLSEELKNEGHKMLQAVLFNWPIMKNSSIALLQNEFLQRPGKIILTEDNPKVIIERKTQDILLEKMNWNLGIVKLAWKDKIIFVDW